jgi:ABC-type Fe3+-siderophore transport system permease subunit
MGIFFFVGVGIYFSRIFKFRLDLNRPLLIGISFNLFVGGFFSLAQFFFQAFNVPFPNELWFGHFRDVNQEAFLSLLSVSIFANFVLLKLHRKITMYSLGPMISQNLNVNSGQLYRWIFVTVGISLFVVISHFGVFSFLGLIFPIFARKFWFKKFDLMGEMHLGSWMNGLFLMGLDYLCYELPIKGAEVPVGLIVSVVGAVSLILLLRKPNSGFETLAKR